MPTDGEDAFIEYAKAQLDLRRECPACAGSYTRPVSRYHLVPALSDVAIRHGWTPHGADTGPGRVTVTFTTEDEP